MKAPPRSMVAPAAFTLRATEMICSSLSTEQGPAMRAKFPWPTFRCSAPTSMTESFTLPTHFESGTGVGIAGILPTGRYSVVKIGGRRLDRFYGAEGTVTANTKIAQRCRTQVSFRFDSLEDFDRFFANRLGNHVILTAAL